MRENSKIHAINGFANITITTSFLGVSLGLFDFLADALQRPNTLRGKFELSALTFLPPILFAIFYPHGFILALGYAAICVAFSHVMLPALIVWQLRKRKIPSPYRVFGGKILLFIVLLAGFLLIILQIMDRWNLLPIFRTPWLPITYSFFDKINEKSVKDIIYKIHINNY